MTSKSKFSPERRRTNRLIESPWVYNWKKKALVFVILDDDGNNNSISHLVGQNIALKDSRVGSRGINNLDSRTLTLPKLDIRNEMIVADRRKRGDESERDDDFVTPCEKSLGAEHRRSNRLIIFLLCI
ncbi:hypothetical protein DCAR_0518588 [Daucus carota subsp. sativus]|uniref:Uncharacterized protein n=1 Tax=Daucus carota subsp. sativus TaxID=79200 RepID=A0AAF1B0I9_DAUCS|nr:PREDICTED: uncharacterized protein LOC108222607 [Daucus carota subsp. sativus]WOG99240.1 hypothetical protein DCAR_0518588 [Daucus carota subsp. sativus]